ncbi:Spy/CpxP family protein refolding chaperone [Altericista sp. CCNU0014]|uniref:Spy/CpxP family protein refolding chaperone n=1 Tax=Altericista sp. CCNU0014 TaxID=3082949 RepID=UPI00384ABE73
MNSKHHRASSFKTLPLLLGLISLTLSATALSPSFAQSSDPSVRPEKSRSHKGGWEALNLTADQKAQMKRIRDASKAQRDAVLTQAQRDTLKAAKANRENRRQAYAALNLTAEQRAKLQEIARSSKQQIQAILTPEQRQAWEQYRSTQRKSRQPM